MASLYEVGWRQGSIVEFELPLDAVVIGASGVPERSPGSHGLWAVATSTGTTGTRGGSVPTIGLCANSPEFTHHLKNAWSDR